jgi:transglutaminase-like putative cysteine protease
VVAAFGDFQTFDYNLTYHLQNSLSKTVIQTIALPPDTPYQRVFYDTLDPLPLNVIPDEDGNWLASYSVKPQQTVQIITSGQVHLLGSPTQLANLVPSPAQLDKYLLPTSFWQSDSLLIRQLSAKYSTPSDIYNYVVSTLSYDYSRVQSNPQRKGALGALSSPDSSLCTEFTDAFIAIARAGSIPARELNGFAFTTDPHLKPLSLSNDVLHSWPEYWDSQSRAWRSIDPTWGKTTGGVDYFDKLDLAHFVFAIHGTDSSLPRPAGLYKLSPSSKDVEVKVGQYKDYQTRSLDLQWHRPFQFIPFLTNTSQIVIKNPNGVAMYNLPISIEAQNISLTKVNILEFLPVIPPFGQITLTLSHPRSLIPSLNSKFLSLRVGNQSVTYNIPETKFYVWYAILTIAVTSAIFAVAFLTHHAWHLYFQRRKV